MDQQIKAAEIITNAEKAPLANVGFTLAIGTIVPWTCRFVLFPPTRKNWRLNSAV